MTEDAKQPDVVSAPVASRAAGDAAARRRQVSGGDDIFGLVIGVALFGWFGFFGDWSIERNLQQEILPMIVLFKWTLRVCAVAFLVSILLAFAKRRESLLVAGVVGGLGALAMIVVAIWDYGHPEYTAGLPEFVLLLFGLWNGWVSMGSLRSYAGAR